MTEIEGVKVDIDSQDNIILSEYQPITSLQVHVLRDTGTLQVVIPRKVMDEIVATQLEGSLEKYGIKFT